MGKHFIPKLDIYRQPSGDFLVQNFSEYSGGSRAWSATSCERVVHLDRARMEREGLTIVSEFLEGAVARKKAEPFSGHRTSTAARAGLDPLPRVHVEGVKKAAWDLTFVSPSVARATPHPFALKEGAAAFFAKIEELLAATRLDPALDRIAALPPLAAHAGRFFATRHFNLWAQPASKLYEIGTRAPTRPEDVVWCAAGPFPLEPLFSTTGTYPNGNTFERFVDLTTIPDDFLPTSWVRRTGSDEAYRAATPVWGDRPTTDFYRLLLPISNRGGLRPEILSAIIPPGVAHDHDSSSFAFDDDGMLLLFAGLTASRVLESFIRARLRDRSYGSFQAWDTAVARLPYVDTHPGVADAIRARVLRLACVTSHYADLWSRSFREALREERWIGDDPRLPGFGALGHEWTRDATLRTPLARRLALAEIDALAALLFGVTLEDARALDANFCADLREAERQTWYDSMGKIAHTSDKRYEPVRDLGALDAEELRRARRALAAGEALPSDLRAKEIRPPFDVFDSVAHFERAYSAFSERFGLRIEAAEPRTASPEAGAVPAAPAAASEPAEVPAPLEGPAATLAALLAGSAPKAERLDLSRAQIGALEAEALAAVDLGEVSAIDLTHNRIGPIGAAAVARAPWLARVTSLVLRDNGVGDEGAAALGRSELTGALTHLDLGWNEISDEGAKGLAASTHLDRLKALNLEGVALSPRIGDAGATALASSPAFASLRDLRLGGNAIGSKGASAIVTSPHLARLSSLDLGSNDKVGDPFARKLAKASTLVRLRALRLKSTRISDEGLIMIVGSRRIAALERLALGRPHEESFLAIARSPHLSRLEALSADGNAFTDDAARAFAGSASLRALKELAIGATTVIPFGHPGKLEPGGMGPDGIEALVASDNIAGLTELGIYGHVVGPRGAAAIARSPRLARLTRLDLGYCHILDEGFAAIARSPHLGALEALFVSENGITEEGFAVLADPGALPRLRALTIGDKSPIKARVAELLAHRGLELTPAIRWHHW